MPLYVVHVRRACLLALTSLLAFPSLTASAESPSPPVPASASPSPKPSSPTTAAPAGTPSPAPPEAPAPSPRATVEPSPSVAPEIEAIDAAVAEQMRRTIAATSLAERIEAQRRLAGVERDLLLREIDRIRERQAAAAAREAELARAIADRRAVLDRLVGETYRVSRTTTLEALLRRGSIVDALVHVDDLSRLSAKQRETLEQLRADERRLAEERAVIARDEGDLAALQASVETKDATLRRLAAWAEALIVATRQGTATDAQIGVLREIADATARQHEETERLIREIARRSGEDLPALDQWKWPLGGVVTQEFGPSTLTLEPPMTYRGVHHPHFHDGIDIAAPLGSPVRAVARGRVAFVGHLSGGAMVVIVAHADDLISLYGHLDDATFRPPVRTGDAVEAGETIGAVGLTGLTTGPHLHFSLRRSTEPIDPRSIIRGGPSEVRGSQGP